MDVIIENGTNNVIAIGYNLEDPNDPTKFKRIKLPDEVAASLNIQDFTEDGSVIPASVYEPGLADYKWMKKEEIKKESAKRGLIVTISGLGEFDDFRLQIDKDSRNDLDRTMLALREAITFEPILWLDADDSLLSMTAKEFRTLITVIYTYGKEVFRMRFSHKANVERLTSIQEVINYDYSTGWPSDFLVISQNE